MDCLNVIESMLKHHVSRKDDFNDPDDETLASEQLVSSISRVYENFCKTRTWKELAPLKRILFPYMWFSELKPFNVLHMLKDIAIYRENRFLFLNYEVTEKKEIGWTTIGTYQNLDAMFATLRHMNEEKHHVTKVLYKQVESSNTENKSSSEDLYTHEKEGDKKDEMEQREQWEFTGYRVFP
jgi:hypothetical protein